jgi:hypothetical protein
MAGCANDKVANAKLLKLKKNFFTAIASCEWLKKAVRVCARSLQFLQLTPSAC